MRRTSSPPTSRPTITRASSATKTTTTHAKTASATTTTAAAPRSTRHPISLAKSLYLEDFSLRSLDSLRVTSDRYGASNRAFVSDPINRARTVLQVSYPAGSFSPSGPIVGGTGFYASPIDLTTANSVTFSYDVYFMPDFDFVLGGKLPGMYGGHESCSGGRDSSTCFSSRFMFRTNGAGELYVYLDFSAQVAGFCKVPPKTICNPSYGTSMGRGAWMFPTGRWITVSQTVTLNTLGKRDGSVLVTVDGVQKIFFDQIAWRTTNIGFIGIDFETFFGGSNSDWATPVDQYTLYKGIALTIEQ